MNATAEGELVLAPRDYGKIGALHCGVTREGFVTVGGDVAAIGEGESVRFERHRVTVRRDGEDYRFVRDPA